MESQNNISCILSTHIVKIMCQRLFIVRVVKISCSPENINYRGTVAISVLTNCTNAVKILHNRLVATMLTAWSFKSPASELEPIKSLANIRQEWEHFHILSLESCEPLLKNCSVY